MLTDEQITKFQKLYKAKFGKDIGRDEACEKGIKLIRIMQLTYRPITKVEFNKLQKNEAEN